MLYEGLPCPCAGSSDTGTPPAPGASAPAGSCVRPKGVQSIAFSATRFAGIRADDAATYAIALGVVGVLNVAGGGYQLVRGRRFAPTQV